MSKMKDEIRDILKSYYFTEWEDDDDCINTLMPKIEALISQNYIPKERVLSREDIAKALFVGGEGAWDEAPVSCKNLFLGLADRVLKAGSIEKKEITKETEQKKEQKE